MLFCGLLIFLKITFLRIPTVWTLIRPDDWLGLIWVQTVFQGYQQTTLLDKELNALMALIRIASPASGLGEDLYQLFPCIL